ncbi:hypothetical protein M422DRAFT_166474 [Sphaerobolus stellatus SS14]|uniref:Protein yippee-like n=1 Tax=Sphaerobolus stellatus (strain SS14) TaxID=990650 RepID=A0A0C9VT65_SPHS4|nr:hypothetical protein M422DRAFT_187202 [Sphaerobolus stellatus SS14]KIJ45752.1 hypothetical protein M422DRAFT_166474 [Sphaerobolus stellatus SS14]
MGWIHRDYLHSARIFGCSTCRTHLATIESMISRAFNGQHGRAYLFDRVVNVYSAEPQERQMTTGVHIVRDILCVKCNRVLGWKYDKAFEETQKYKEGKFILERALLTDVD